MSVKVKIFFHPPFAMFLSVPLLNLCHRRTPHHAVHSLRAKLKSLGVDQPLMSEELLRAIARLEYTPALLTLDDFEKVLWPFAQRLLKSPPLVKSFDRAFSAGKDILGKLEMLWLIAEHREKAASSDVSWDQFCEFEFLASGLCDREPQAGWHLYLPNRPEKVWRVDWSHCEAGAFIWVLRPIEDPSEAIVVCRGTAFRWRAIQGFQSSLNDLLPQMGGWGFKSIWPSLREWLVSENIRSIEVMGKSLGSTIAQMVVSATLHDTLIDVKDLHTLQGAGTDERVHQTFERIIKTRKTPLNLRITRWNVHFKHLPVDLVPFLGGYHLGQSPHSSRAQGLLIRNVYVGDHPSYIEVSLSKTKQVLQLALGLCKTHMYQVRFMPNIPSINIEILDKSNPTGPLLPIVEPLRQIAAKIITFSGPLLKRLTGSRFEHAIESGVGLLKA